MVKKTKGQCPGCEALINFSKVDPFTAIECPECGMGLVVPWDFCDYLLTQKENRDERFFDYYLGYNKKNGAEIRALLLRKEIKEYDYWLKFCKEEASSIRTIDHANVLPLLDYGICMGSFYIIEPHLKGFSITEYDPNKVGELEIQSVINFGKKVALAIEAINHKEFTHHNINPDNIFIDEKGELKITNLFVSRFNYFYDKRINESHFSVSPYYISPEKAEKKEESKKGDAFSFGVFLYYFITGHYPFTGDNEHEIIYKRVKRKKSDDSILSSVEYQEPEPVSEYRKDEIRQSVNELILKFLKPYPIQRPTVGEFVSTLKLIEVDDNRRKSEEKRKQLLDSVETSSIPEMDKLS
ncbi:MAG: protein kinase [Victivallales bacterium]|nr:protein kinase [Victivallales bacterium]